MMELGDLVFRRLQYSSSSAAHAALDTVMSLNAVTAEEDWHSVALASDGSYGVEKGLICYFPTRSKGSNASIVQGVDLGEFGKAKLQQTVNELLEEKAMVSELLPS